MGFLRKHFNLNRHVPQNNNFVVFNAYFHPSTHRHSYGPPVTVSKVSFSFPLSGYFRLSRPPDSEQLLFLHECGSFSQITSLCAKGAIASGLPASRSASRSESGLLPSGWRGCF